AVLCDRFLHEYSGPGLKSPEDYRRKARYALNRVLPLIGERCVASLRPSDVARVRDTLTRKLAAATVRLALAILSAAFSWAVTEGLAPANPCKGVDRPRAAQNLDFLNREEVKTLLGAAERQAQSPAGWTLYVAIALGSYAGLRKGELCGLRWTDVDLE